MLVKLLKRDIINHWGMIEESFKHAPNADQLYDNRHKIMETLLIGKADVWCTIREDEIRTVLLTSMIYDPITLEKGILLYYTHALKPTEDIDWAEGIVTLKRYAKAEGCTHVVAYSKVPKVIEMARLVGGDIDTRMLTFKVE